MEENDVGASGLDRRTTLSTLRYSEMTPVSSDFKIIYVNDLRY